MTKYLLEQVKKTIFWIYDEIRANWFVYIESKCGRKELNKKKKKVNISKTKLTSENNVKCLFKTEPISFIKGIQKDASKQRSDCRMHSNVLGDLIKLINRANAENYDFY